MGLNTCKASPVIPEQFVMSSSLTDLVHCAQGSFASTLWDTPGPDWGHPSTTSTGNHMSNEQSGSSAAGAVSDRYVADQSAALPSHQCCQPSCLLLYSTMGQLWSVPVWPAVKTSRLGCLSSIHQFCCRCSGHVSGTRSHCLAMLFTQTSQEGVS